MAEFHLNSHWLAETERLGLSYPGFPIATPTFYGQCGEDYLCLSILRALATREGLDLTQETYAEIGAFHPVAGSATYLLHRGLGMTGVLIEANPALLPELARHRPHDRLLHLCITPQPQDFATLHIAPKGELSSIDPDFLARFTGNPSEAPVEVVTVPALTLSELMAREFARAPLMMSIDLEGIDQAVIASYDFVKRPFLIQIEANEDHAPAAFRAIERTLLAQDYRIIARTDVNQLAVDLRRLSRAGLDSSLALGTTGLDQLLDHIQALTLDVFDTIFARRAVEPVDVFRWIETAEGWPGFADARIKAEATARRDNAARGSEVALDEIYAVLSRRLPLPADAADREIKAEGRFLYPNPAIAQLIARARLAGRRVIAISDIYLSSAQVDGLLRGAGIQVDKVYTSSDHRTHDLGKYNGKLFDLVLKSEGLVAERVLHVGDNPVSDVANAQAAGLCAIETRQLHRIHTANDVHASALRQLGSTPSGSIVFGQYTQWLACSATPRSMVESFGYAYGGPLLVGFVQYLVAEAKAAGIHRLLLLERDGAILAAAFRALSVTEVEYRLVPASRRMTVFPTLDGNDIGHLQSMFQGYAPITEREFFEILSLRPTDHVMDEVERLLPIQHLKRHEAFLRTVAAEEKALILQELAEERAMLAEGRKVAWVDVGWALTSIRALNELLGEDIPAFCVGSHDRTTLSIRHQGYLFTRSQPSDISAVIMTGVELIELIFSATSHSTVYLTRGADGIQRVRKPKNTAERIRDGHIAEVWKGALAFVTEIRDLLPGLSVEDLRTYNREALVTLCEAPLDPQYDALGDIPHDRLVGGNVWQKIRDFWKPNGRRYEGAHAAARIADLQYKLQMARRRPHKLLKQFFIFRLLRWLSTLSPPLPQRMAARFARSAAKRNPRRIDS